jgi:hypothetical protein
MKRNRKPWSELREATKKKIYFARKRKLEKKQKKAGDKRVGAFERDMLARLAGYNQISKVSKKKVSEKSTTKINAKVAATEERIAKILEKDANRTPEEVALANERQQKAVLRTQRPSQIYGQN